MKPRRDSDGTVLAKPSISDGSFDWIPIRVLPFWTCNVAMTVGTAVIGRSCDSLSTRGPDIYSTRFFAFSTRSFDAIELFHDRVDDARIHRLDFGREHGGDMAVTADQVFVKIPA